MENDGTTVWIETGFSAIVWHLADEGSGETQCGMSTGSLRADETPWPRRAEPMRQCKWLASSDMDGGVD